MAAIIPSETFSVRAISSFLYCPIPNPRKNKITGMGLIFNNKTGYLMVQELREVQQLFNNWTPCVVALGMKMDSKVFFFPFLSSSTPLSHLSFLLPSFAHALPSPLSFSGSLFSPSRQDFTSVANLCPLLPSFLIKKPSITFVNFFFQM
jgi:hypothetical protein